MTSRGPSEAGSAEISRDATGSARRWGAFLRSVAVFAFALAVPLLLFNLLVDPYDASPMHLPFRRPLMDINQRFMYPQVLRSGEFDGAVFGTSTLRLLKPADLEAGFGGRFANFGMNAATPFEQSQAVRLYVAHTPRLRTLVWGLDSGWCEEDADQPAKLVTERAFPPWLYGESRFAAIPHMFNLRTLEISARLVLNRLGLMKERLPRNGYEVFTPPEQSYDAARARQHIWGGRLRPVAPDIAPAETGAAERARWRYPGLRFLAEGLRGLPKGARLILVFPPVHIAFEPPPASPEGARAAECKRRAAAIAQAQGGIVVDFGFPSPITRVDENYWDPLHYRLPIARRVAEALQQAAEGERNAADFRVVAAEP
jgi:hypothetical protein